MNKQRESVYTLRREILEGKVHLTEDDTVDTRAYVLALAEDILDDQIDRFAGEKLEFEEWDIPALIREASRVFGLDPVKLEALDLKEKSTDEIGDAIWALAKTSYEEKDRIVGGELLRRVERDIMLQIVDHQWKDHLYSLDHLKEGIGLRGYGQRDPLVEYKKESFSLFQDMKARIEEEIVRTLFWLRPVLNEDVPAVPRARRATQMTMNNPAAEVIPAFAAARSAAPTMEADVPMPGGQPPRPPRVGGDDVIKTVRREEPKIGRNDPCPCGSGKKYKKCHGAAA
jgi:preprotein translocase subunit SecA